jgi:DNA-binding transcriptional LysR family regulator
MTPSQLRAFAEVVRLGSVKAAAANLQVSQAAVSMQVAQLRKELGDQLFVRTGSGIAFTPGGLRLASRATEMLGLQERTIREVSQAGGGRRLLRVACSTLFAEHAAPGLIKLFSERADDLDVELSVHPSSTFESLLTSRAVDAAIGPRPEHLDGAVASTGFLSYQVVAVVHPDHPLTKGAPSHSELRRQTWVLGPAAASDAGVIPSMLRRLAVPEDRQQIFPSQAAALEEAKRGSGIALAVAFAAAQDIAHGDVRRLAGPLLQAQGTWSLLTLADLHSPSPAAELTRFVTTPRATQAMLRGAGVAVGRFRPSIHVTLWS